MCVRTYIYRYFLLSVPSDVDDKMYNHRQRVGFETGSEDELDKNVCINAMLIV